ncbi:uncharacterized protein LOC133036585 [Cannabis sativa]|uniref:uncharacterized protein LOC133036585 n=1 Tax=Cannabis sativa TaxID=3483 RepID=UPI0029C9BE5D|nr:uncharacterized protein LOC133036585 [Cannabis sativa]
MDRRHHHKAQSKMAPRLIIPAPEHFTGRVTYRGTGIFAKIKARFEEFNLNNTAKESRFGSFWNAVPLTFSSVLFHQLMLHKMKVDAQEELRMRFYVGRKEVRFGVLEFALITGLDFSSGPTEEEKAAQVARSGSDRLINKYFNRSDSVKTEALQLQFTNCQNPEDLYKLGLCLFVESVLLGREANALITPHIIRYVEDLEFFFRIPWGKHSFARLMHSLQKDMLKQKANYEKKLSSDVQHECKYTAYGFAPAVQYWAYEAILEVGKRYGTNHGIRGSFHGREEEAFVRTISYDGVENPVDDAVDDTRGRGEVVGYPSAPKAPADPSTPPPAASPPVEEDEVFHDDYDPYEGAPATPIEAQPLIHVHDTESQGEITSIEAQPAVVKSSEEEEKASRMVR